MPDADADRPKDEEPSVERRLVLAFQADATVNYASVQNSVPIGRQLEVTNGTDTPLIDLAVTVRPATPFAQSRKFVFEQLAPGETRRVEVVNLVPEQAYLAALTEAERSAIECTATVGEGEDVLATARAEVDVLAANQWAGTRALPSLLAAFSQPNIPVIEGLLRSASERLRRANSTASLNAYQSHNREEVWAQLSAIYSTVAALDIHYSQAPASFETDGQKIRTAEQILERRLANCLDLTMLFGACMEQVGLHPVVLLGGGHAWAGCWLTDTCFPTTVTDDAQSVRKRVQTGEFIGFECTGVTTSPKLILKTAANKAAENLEVGFQYAIDLHRCREEQIRPLPSRTTALQGQVAQVQAEELEIEAAPALPPLDAGDAVVIGEDAALGRLSRWKAKLLDMTLRNRLLNFKQSKSNLELVVPDMAAVEDKLAKGAELSFKPYPTAMDAADPRSEKVYATRHGSDAIADLARDALGKNELITRAGPDKFETHLLDLFRVARTGIEESGANALHLAVGMLQWTETDTSERKLLAPILMLPVSLTRTSVRSGFKLKRTDDEPFVNPTLLQLLREQFQINLDVAAALPTDDAGVDVERVLQAFRLAITQYRGWEVKTEVHLGIFSFAKFVMWRDLQSRIEDLTRNRVVAHLLNTPGQVFDGKAEQIDETTLDDRFAPNEILSPLLADSSQLAALAKVSAGMDLVIIGPPGCGKTQVLANTVAQLMAEGKKVLVCSEKAAALEVLHRRLKQIGLGPYVLELHSSKANKVGVLKQLEEALQQAGTRPAADWEREAQKLAALRDALNGVVRALHRRHQNGLTVFQATGSVVGAADQTPSAFDWDDADAHDDAALDRLRECAKQMQSTAGALHSINLHPLRAIQKADWSSAWQDDVAKVAARLCTLAPELEKVAAPVFRHLGLPEKGGSLEHYAALDALADVLLQVGSVPPGFARVAHSPQSTERLALLKAHGLKRQQAWQGLASRYHVSVEKMRAEVLEKRWAAINAKWFLPKWLETRALLKELQAFRSDQQAIQGRDVPALIAALKELNAEDAAIARVTAGHDLELAGAWPGVHGSLGAMDGYAAWSTRYQHAVTRLCSGDLQRFADLTQRLQLLVSDQRPLLQATALVGQKLLAVREATLALVTELAKAQQLAQNATMAGQPTDAGFIVRVHAEAERWRSSIRVLRDWCAWRSARDAALGLGLKPLVDDVEEGRVAVAGIAGQFEFSYRAWWLKRTVDKDPVLRTFSSADHARKIVEFQEADKRFQDLTRKYVAAKVAASIPEQRALQPAAESEMGRLRREMQKQRGHLAIRKLIEGMPTLLPRLKPCVLMSPLSVATYLDTAQATFDVVLFDEASQIPAWDAVGAIARAHQAVIVGDPKQLPPTSFFQKVDDVDEAAEEAGEVADLESILDECLGAGLPAVDLRWHYRSRHEALISFSNARYYEGRLITFPSNATEDKSVELRKVNGIYDRGGSRINRLEAEEVVNEIELHFLDPARRAFSVGVVTFNQPQQQLIEQLLDARRRANPALDTAIAERTFEPFFIKNLENVQGDERDRMLFSICYGRDIGGRLTMNFGPLNLEGGHRRLNVAITRAREQVSIFSSLLPEDIDPGRVSARGVLDLKTYLEFASKGQRALATESLPTGREPDSPFEVAVIAKLRDRGWTVHPQIGASGYRIDIGVVDPRAPGRYLLGVECDGAMYHSAATARDRDRLRQLVLEGLGWKLHRIWSTDWWIDAETQTSKLIARLKELEIEEAPPAQGPPQHQAPAPVAATTYERQVQPDPDPPAPPPPSDMRVRLPRYTPVEVKGGTPESFYDYSADARIELAMEQIIEAEAPILDAVVYRRVARAWGLERTGTRIVEKLNRIARGFRTTGRVPQRFFWRKTDDPATWTQFRVADTAEDTKRKPDEICAEEIQNIAAYVLHHSGSMPLEDLAREAGRLVGIARASRDWTNQVEAACKERREVSRLVIAQGAVRLSP